MCQCVTLCVVVLMNVLSSPCVPRSWRQAAGLWSDGDVTRQEPPLWSWEAAPFGDAICWAGQLLGRQFFWILSASQLPYSRRPCMCAYILAHIHTQAYIEPPTVSHTVTYRKTMYHMNANTHTKTHPPLDRPIYSTYLSNVPQWSCEICSRCYDLSYTAIYQFSSGGSKIGYIVNTHQLQQSLCSRRKRSFRNSDSQILVNINHCGLVSANYHVT